VKLARFVLTILFLCEIQLAWADAFILDNGVFTTFNVPGAMPNSTVATGVNDSGQIVGYFSDSAGQRYGFLDTDGVFTTINFPGAALTAASGINNAGQIVGGFQATLAQLPQSFLDSSGVFSVVPVGGDINDSGQIVGSVGAPGITTETAAVLNTNGVLTTLMLPFSNLASSEGIGINDSGQIVGVYFSSSNGTFVAHGFLDSNGAFSSIDDPGAAGTYAYGINDSGVIVGFEQIGPQLTNAAFIDNNGTFTTFQVPGGVGTVAYSINDQGEVVGSFTPAVVPEPTSFALLIAGLTALVGGVQFSRLCRFLVRARTQRKIFALSRWANG
jgi:probable HAF family extracellular repeat protein